jgi:hypothetical protein
MLQSEEDFVMVPSGGIYNVSYTNPPNQARGRFYTNPTQPTYQYNNSQNPHQLLSTSPGTGGALMAMMVSRENAMANNNSSGNVSTNSASTNNSFSGQGGGSPSSGAANFASNSGMQLGGVEMAAKMLAAAEDVGRRAVNIAHVGDTRAYVAMRLMMESQQIGGGGFSASAASSLASERRPSDDSSSPAKGDANNVQPSSSPTSAATVSSNSSSATSAHLKEALSLYVYALRLMKGAVGAAQRVMDVVRTTIEGGGGGGGGGVNNESHQALFQRFHPRTS